MRVDDGRGSGKYEISITASGFSGDHLYLLIRHPLSGYAVLTMTGTREMIADAVRAWVMANE